MGALIALMALIGSGARFVDFPVDVWSKSGALLRTGVFAEVKGYAGGKNGRNRLARSRPSLSFNL